MDYNHPNDNAKECLNYKGSNEINLFKIKDFVFYWEHTATTRDVP